MTAIFSKDRFYEPVSGLSLAVFRIMMGLLLVRDAWKHFYYSRLDRYYDRPILFKYEYFEWVVPYPEQWMMEYHAAIMVLLAVLITLGLFYRFSIIVFLFMFTYLFLLDQAEYLNHYYLTIIYLCLMCFLPMHARLSLDLWRKKDTPRDVPRWALWALIFQTEIVLLYAGIVKINADWLGGEPLGIWLRERWQWHIFGDLVFEDWFIIAGAWAAMLIHIIGAPLLLYRKTRLAIFFAYCAFHLMNSYTFQIGIFPYMTIGATLLFFRPDWPAYLCGKVAKVFDLPIKVIPFRVEPPKNLYNKPVIAFLMVWLFLQIVIPLRPYVYPGNVAWTEEGHKFSWRMKLRNKESTKMLFTITDPKSGEVWQVQPFDVLDYRSAFQMAERINMLLQYAYYLEEEWKKKGYDDVIVTAETAVSLNGRKAVPIVSPDLDLTTVKWDIWPADWILENNEEIEHWTKRPQRLK